MGNITPVMYNNSFHKTCMMYRIVYSKLSYSLLFQYAMWYELDIPHSRKYWQSLNLAVWPQTDHKKIMAEF